MGCFSVPACPNAVAQAQNNPKTGKNSLRIAGGEAYRSGSRLQRQKGRFARGIVLLGSYRVTSRSPATCWFRPQAEIRAL
jgi:hypothetical protein